MAPTVTTAFLHFGKSTSCPGGAQDARSGSKLPRSRLGTGGFLLEEGPVHPFRRVHAACPLRLLPCCQRLTSPPGIARRSEHAAAARGARLHKETWREIGKRCTAIGNQLKTLASSKFRFVSRLQVDATRNEKQGSPLSGRHWIMGNSPGYKTPQHDRWNEQP
jgi:hypothetical protein